MGFHQKYETIEQQKIILRLSDFKIRSIGGNNRVN